MLETHKELGVWQKSFRLCTRVHAVTREFPPEERFDLTAQLRRTAVSVPSNIAEGYNRATRRDYLRFLWMANGSLAELETQLLLAEELRLAGDNDLSNVLESVNDVDRMLRSLIRALVRKGAAPS